VQQAVSSWRDVEQQRSKQSAAEGMLSSSAASSQELEGGSTAAGAMQPDLTPGGGWYGRVHPPRRRLCQQRPLLRGAVQMKMSEVRFDTRVHLWTVQDAAPAGCWLV
jgi:hypothetical protein